LIFFFVVLYQDQWWDAKILKYKLGTVQRTIRVGNHDVPHDDDTYLYHVQYASDHAKQNNVPEECIRARNDDDHIPQQEAHDLAISIGLGPGWHAIQTGGEKVARLKITSPTGEVFTSKKRALDVYLGIAAPSPSPKKDSEASTSVTMMAGTRHVLPERDPPWRTTGHPYLGRRIVYTTEHAVTSRRTVTVDQLGTVTGWIADTDVNRRGQPAYVSTRNNNLPSNLYHVTFPADPNNTYAYHLVESADMEESELLDCLIPEKVKSTGSNRKKAKIS
jgi:hypothetical protein